MNDKITKSPVTELKDELRRHVVAPLIIQLDAVHKELLAMGVKIADAKADFASLIDGRNIDTRPITAPTRKTPATVFDMETAIKAAGKWECNELRCRLCSVEQNMDCLVTYEIVVSKIEGDSPPLHADEVPPPGPPLPSNIVPVTKLKRVAAQAKAAEEEEEDDEVEETEDEEVETAEPGSLEAMPRPALVKMAAGLGVAKSVKLTRDELIAAITAASTEQKAKVKKEKAPPVKAKRGAVKTKAQPRKAAPAKKAKKAKKAK